jgi:hypothetical protein
MVIAAIIATIRCARTPDSDADRPARKDVASLLWASAVGMALVALRSRYNLNTKSFYICSGLLIPVVLVVLFLLARLIARYRDERQ